MRALNIEIDRPTDLRLLRPALPPKVNNKPVRSRSSRETFWQTAVETLDYALQPIVNIHTGVCEGCEALLRHHEQLGFTSIPELFNRAYQDGLLPEVEPLLRAKAIEKFMEIPFHHRLRLFYNLDNRLLSKETCAHQTNMANFVRQFGLHPTSLVYEISERHEENMLILHDPDGLENIKRMLLDFHHEQFRFAIDDFGTGLSGLQLLYHTDPDYLKIDRFFIDGMGQNRRKKLFVSSTVNMARTLGNAVVAEGVESEADFLCCQQVGCDYVQGYLVQRPTLVSGEIRESYPLVIEIHQRNRRMDDHDHDLIRRQGEFIHPIKLYNKNRQLTPLDQVLETFRHSKGITIFPVVNEHNEPVGVIREKDLKEYVYSPFGKDILRNRAVTSSCITQFITRLPVTEVRTKVHNILEIFSLNPECEGALLTDNGNYQGFLSAHAMLKLVFEKNLEEARDQNPLTRMPGNFLVTRFISEGNSDQDNAYVYCYFDFDNFKPFNDKYGLRKGDRAITMFADLLKEHANRLGCFAGHVGGDDFFLGFRLDTPPGKTNLYTLDPGQCAKVAREICRRFAADAANLYGSGTRKRGYIEGLDRDGQPRRFPLLTVSAAMITLPRGERTFSLEEIFTMLAELKKQAKASVDKFSLLNVQ